MTLKLRILLLVDLLFFFSKSFIRKELLDILLELSKDALLIRDHTLRAYRGCAGYVND